MRIFICLITFLNWQSVGAVDSDFERVRRAIFSDPYTQLPHYQVNQAGFGPSGSGAQNLLLRDAKRALSKPSDFANFGDGQKLFQPNGICFAGRWLIDQPAPYSGLFQQDTQVSAIVRLSVMLSGTVQSDKRALAMAIKLFVPGWPRSLNIHVMESMGGRHLKHVTEAVLDNHPGFGSLPKIADMATLLRIRKDLKRALKQTETAGIELRYLPLEHIAVVNIGEGETAVAPHWIRLRVRENTPRVNKKDFREELSLHHYPDHRLIYDIEVAPDNNANKRSADWHRIGRLELTEFVTSKTCDTKLHFMHHGLIK